MISTLKRTITDIMEDELYTPTVVNDQQKQQQQQQQQTQNSHDSNQQSQNDFFQYLSLPNTSQDSFQKFTDSEGQTLVNANNNLPSSNLDGIYSSYGNPDLYTNPQLPDYLYSNNTSINQSTSPTIPNDINLIDPNNTTCNSTNDTSIPIDNAQDDILMIPQDNYFIYDYQQHDPQFIPEMLELELSNKSFPQSNELNIFKANDVLYEFSDDEEDDLDGDMEMKLDNDENDSSEDEDDQDDECGHSCQHDHCHNDHMHDHIDENKNANNYLTSGYTDNSIYSLTVPNYSFNKVDLNLSDEEYNGTTLTNGRIVNNEDDYHFVENEEEEEEEEEDDEDDEDEEEYGDDYAIEDADGGDLYTPMFQHRKASVIADTKPTPRTERALSARHSTRPKRLRRSFNHVSSMSTASSFRKPKASLVHNNSNAANSDTTGNTNTTIDTSATSENNELMKNEEHICTITNPKTGKPCNKKFSRPYDLIRHQNTIHASKRSFYRCMFCEDDLRRKHGLDPINQVVVQCKYRNSQFSKDNAMSHITSSHNVKKIKSGALNNSGYLSNKTFSRCDALTRHLRFRHGLNNNQVVEAMEYAKKNVEYYDN